MRTGEEIPGAYARLQSVRRRGVTAPDGLVLVDKPGGITSHDVVARIRRLAGTRRVGHAGTLDPMATGLLVVGVGRATRLLGHLVLTEKAYDATIRLGQATLTDDAEGEVLRSVPAGGVDDEAIRAGMRALTGDISQVPSQVSAVKIDGKRSYARVRAGEEVGIPARSVRVSAFDLIEVRRPHDRGGELPDGAGEVADDVVDLDVSVVCTSGTYVRALARDLGVAVGVGGHLTALRRTRVGPYRIEASSTLDQLADSFALLGLADAVAAAFPRRYVSEAEARVVGHGGRLATAGFPPGPVGIFGPDGRVLALVEDRDGAARPLVVFVES